ncbi:MAG: CAP domain-containing protein [Patescibacteria group bacterium]|nr:CAP domain-containing protein [Patescibacteria group bacterium]
MSKNKINPEEEYMDSDADGLTDAQEKRMGTNPQNPDTDGDGVGDYVEAVVYGSNPLDPDTDKDGMSDGDEIKHGRNPLGPGNLKDLFIPHAGNNYQPQFLHPKRLAFYGLSAVVVKVVVVLLVLLFPITAWLSPDILQEQSQKIIELTNVIRQNVGVTPLTMSEILNNAAWQKAQDMLVKQYFSHTGPDDLTLIDWLNKVNYSYKVAGENLAIGFASAEEVVNAWTKSQTHYANMIDPEFTQIGVGMFSGQFDQQETTLVAQYFAQPQKEVKNALVQTNQVLADLDLNLENQSSSGQVLAEKVYIKDSVLEPSLISPENNFSTATAQVNLKILAPQASSIIIYLDGKEEISQIKDINQDQVELSINLTPGQHELQIESQRGDQNLISQKYNLTLDQIGPEIDHQQSQLFIDQAQGQDHKIVQAIVYLSSDAQSAEVNFSNYKIDLQQDETDKTKWTGSLIIFDEEDEKLETMTLANVKAIDQVGNQTLEDLNWGQIIPTETSKIKQYLFIRDNPSSKVAAIFNISDWYFKIILILFSLVLILAIVIKIKKQSPKLIISSLILIALLLALFFF